MTVSSRSNTVAALVLGMAIAGSAHASRLQQESPAASTAAARTITSDRSIDDVSRTTCPTGIEHFLPGSYYYCVGVRDVARGENDQARSMLEIAAAWGSKPAEFLLGMGYYKGDIQPLDRARGLAWMGLAAERKDPAYTAIFASAWKHATAQEQASAQALWRSMRPVYGDERAARRAEARFRHERDALVSNSIYGATICIGGLTSGNIDPHVKASDSDTWCQTGQPVDLVAQTLDVYAERLFDGWSGHVSVGPMRAVSSPSK